MLSRLFLVLGRGARAGARPSAASCCGSPPGAGSSRCSPSTASLMLVVGWATLPRDAAPGAAAAARASRGTLRGYGGLLHDRAYVGLVLVAGLTMAGPVQLRVRLGVRLPGRVRPRRAAVRPALRRRRLLADRRHAAQPAAAPPLVEPQQVLVAGTVAGAARRRGARRARRHRHRRAARRRRLAVGRCCSPAGWRCRTPPRWRSPATARRPAPPPRCSAPSSSASARSSRRSSACWATTRWPSASSSSSALTLALVVLVAVVRPWQLTVPDDAGRARVRALTRRSGCPQPVGWWKSADQATMGVT